MPTAHIKHDMLHNVRSDYTSWPFPEAISLKLYFLNEATASTDSGESVFPTRAIRLMKFSELILKMKSNRRKVYPHTSS